MRQIQRQTFGSLEEWRTYHHLTKTAASRYLGIGKSLYGKYENREFSPRPKRALVISAKTGVPFVILMRAA